MGCFNLPIFQLRGGFLRVLSSVGKRSAIGRGVQRSRGEPSEWLVWLPSEANQKEVPSKEQKRQTQVPTSQFAWFLASLASSERDCDPPSGWGKRLARPGYCKSGCSSLVDGLSVLLPAPSKIWRICTCAHSILAISQPLELLVAFPGLLLAQKNSPPPGLIVLP